MGATALPWQVGSTWPAFHEDDHQGERKSFQVPDWASGLAAHGHDLVRTAVAGDCYRSVVIVPTRNSTAIWVTLGALIASLASSKPKDVVAGDTVWFPPSANQTRFRSGVVGNPIRDDYGLFRVDRTERKGSTCLHSCRRDAFFAVDQKPNLDSARSAERMATFARHLGIECGPDECLMLEDAIQIAGNEQQIKDTAGLISSSQGTLADIAMLDARSGFSMCRHLGERKARPSDKAKLVIIDGPGGLAVLESGDFLREDTPAVVILTPDEWISGQPDPDRITNALEDWGESCDTWPPEFGMPGIGRLAYRKGA